MSLGEWINYALSESEIRKNLYQHETNFWRDQPWHIFTFLYLRMYISILKYDFRYMKLDVGTYIVVHTAILRVHVINVCRTVWQSLPSVRRPWRTDSILPSLCLACNHLHNSTATSGVSATTTMGNVSHVGHWNTTTSYVHTRLCWIFVQWGEPHVQWGYVMVLMRQILMTTQDADPVIQVDMYARHQYTGWTAYTVCALHSRIRIVWLYVPCGAWRQWEVYINTTYTLHYTYLVPCLWPRSHDCRRKL